MKRYLLTALLATPLITYAAINELTYQGKPIHPACFAINLGDEPSKVINLDTCNKDKSKVLQKDGYFTNEIEGIKQDSFTRYAVIGNQGDRYLIVSGSWTGGTGFFTDVAWYQKTDHTLHILKSLAGGDRCNGGVEKIGPWQYAVHLTPYDMLTFGGTLSKLNAYQDLDASAAGCVAKAIYQFNPDKQTSTFKMVQLNKKPLSMERWVLELKYQYCFNRLYNTFVETNRLTLSQTDLDHFKNQFETICIDSGR